MGPKHKVNSPLTVLWKCTYLHTYLHNTDWVPRLQYCTIPLPDITETCTNTYTIY